ncbi:MAG TPA: histidine--tRNA ligase, partial [Opitutales bacterium]|nr:histidine--tRNA ligase [Opitutales bacterium]
FSMPDFQSLPGFREFYPEDCAARNGLFRAWRAAARRFGFAEYDAPVLEPLELYQEKSGEEIRSQLFEFTDKGGRNVALRPEMTPSLARLVAAKAGSLRKPLKWFSIGEMYRYEKPQKGRLRSFYQFNADILGEAGPAADAECIALLVEALKESGLDQGEFEVRISDRKWWFHFLASLGLDESKSAEVLSIIDKAGRETPDAIKKKLEPYFGASTEANWNAIKEILSDASALATATEKLSSGVGANATTARFAELRELENRLQQLGVSSFVKRDFSIVRGLAYYTGFVFEAYQTVGTARALAGGGRYDDLLKKLGGVDLPAVGFAIGDVTMTDLLKELNRPLRTEGKLDVYLVIGSDAVRAQALELVGKLRAAGVAVDYPLKDEKFAKQFKAADQVGARLALILGPDEAAQNQVKIKDMLSGVEVVVPNDATLPANVREIAEKGLPA